MIDINDEFIATEARLTLRYGEIERLVAFIKSHEFEDIPETVREEILPIMEDFLIDNY